MKHKKKHIFCLVLFLFSGVTLFLTFNRHSKSGYYNYHSEIWADKAGYYVYLPAAIKFGFNPDNFPDSVDKRTGYGFTFNYQNKKVLTKYTCGVAMLQLPFFLLADAFAKIFQLNPNGFSPVYHWSINVASVFYLVLGLFFLSRYLNVHCTGVIKYLVLLSIFLATNLYYYSIDETGMSHVYSFSLFCAWLFLLRRTHYLLPTGIAGIFLLGVVSGLIVLIRPSNIMFLFSFFFLDTERKSDILVRLKRLLQPAILLPVLTGAIMVITPQLLYWNYAHGSYICYSYGSEGFNWAHPRLVQSWFSPKCGLFIYNPFYLIILASLVHMTTKRMTNGIFIMVLFLAISYVFSSWYEWSFGCALGARSYVEYLAILSIPLSHLFKAVNRVSRVKVIGFWLLVFAFAVLNLKITYSYDGCNKEVKTWDWKSYISLVVSPTK
jgi:hypothetical protein